MSKSVGNVIYPEEIIKKYGADILRLWVASSDFKSDIRVSLDILDQMAEVYRKYEILVVFFWATYTTLIPARIWCPIKNCRNRSMGPGAPSWVGTKGGQGLQPV